MEGCEPLRENPPAWTAAHPGRHIAVRHRRAIPWGAHRSIFRLDARPGRLLRHTNSTLRFICRVEPEEPYAEDSTLARFPWISRRFLCLYPFAGRSSGGRVLRDAHLLHRPDRVNHLDF